jgi:hydroxymethylbilane synthase
MMRQKITIGTRKSALALWQSNFIKGEIERTYPGVQVELKHIVTMGDKTQDSTAAIPAIGGKGLFTAELEEALLSKEIDLAVHSLKDLPTTIPDTFVLGAIPKRAAPNDIYISRTGQPLSLLPAGAVVGTSSLRRVSQILRLRPDLKTLLIRGNVDTRIRKLKDPAGPYDAILLAQAGIERLGLMAEVTEVLSLGAMLPAPGQGAMAVECRVDDESLINGLRFIHDHKTMVETTAERCFLQALGAGCNTPVAAFAEMLLVGEGESARKVLSFKGRCLATDASQVIEVSGESTPEGAAELGIEMARVARSQGFNELSI